MYFFIYCLHRGSWESLSHCPIMRPLTCTCGTCVMNISVISVITLSVSRGGPPFRLRCVHDPKVAGPKADKCCQTLIAMRLNSCTDAESVSVHRPGSQEDTRVFKEVGQQQVISDSIGSVWQRGCLEGRLVMLVDYILVFRKATWLFSCPFSRMC